MNNLLGRVIDTKMTDENMKIITFAKFRCCFSIG